MKLSTQLDFTGFKREIIMAVFVTALVISNVIATRLVVIFGLITPGAFALYAVTFLMTDLMSELYGLRDARRLVLVGFLCSLLSLVAITLTGAIAAPPFAQAQADAYRVLLGSTWRIILGSMVAYYASQSWDVWIFNKIGRRTGTKRKWLRNNLSTMSSQAIDTVLFVVIAFAGNGHVVEMLVAQYVLKLAVAAIDTPIFYLLTRGSRSVFQEA